MRLRQPVHPQLLPYGGAVESEPLGGDPAIAVDAAQDLVERRRLDDTEQLLVQVGRALGVQAADAVGEPADDGGGELFRRVGGRQAGGGGEVLGQQRPAASDDDCVFERVAQLADVAQPRLRREVRGGGGQ